MKKIYNLPEKSKLPKFILPVTISWLIIFCGFQGGNEKFAEIRAGSLSRLAAWPLDFALAATPRALVLQRENADRLSTLIRHENGAFRTGGIEIADFA